MFRHAAAPADPITGNGTRVHPRATPVPFSYAGVLRPAGSCERRCRTATCRRPRHALPAPARCERDAHCVRACQRPVARGARRGRRDAADQLRGGGNRPGLQRGRAVDRVLWSVRREHRCLSDACYRRTARAAHVASGGGCGGRGGPPRATSFSSRAGTRCPPGCGSSTRCRRRAGSRRLSRSPQAYLGGMSADGAYLAYQEIGHWDPEWRNYRGGQAQPIGIVSTADWERTTPSWEGERQMDPVWMDGVVYYMSERDWASNVWSFDPRTGAERQLTRHADFDVKSLGAGDGVVVYEQGGVSARAGAGVGARAQAGDPGGRRHELVEVALGGGSVRADARRTPLAHGQARALRVAGRGLQRARGGGVVAEPHAHPGRGRPPSGVVSGRGRASPGSTTRPTNTAW